MNMNKMTVFLGVIFLLSAMTGGAFADDEEKLNLNAATAEELVKIPGLNKELAEGILELREENGEFIDMEELLDVPGIDNQLRMVAAEAGKPALASAVK